MGKFIWKYLKWNLNKNQILGGMVLQTNMNEILARIDEQNKLQKQEAGISAAPSRAFSTVKSINLPQQIKGQPINNDFTNKEFYIFLANFRHEADGPFEFDKGVQILTAYRPQRTYRHIQLLAQLHYLCLFLHADRF